jgi:hypothetical protein
MSAKPPALVYNDAEKGTLDARSPQIADLAKSEKKAADIDVFPVQSLKKDAPVTPSDVAKPPPAPAKPAKKRAPLWVLWVIWYNSYRYMIFDHKSISNTHPLCFIKAFLYCYIHRQLHWTRLCDRW